MGGEIPFLLSIDDFAVIVSIGDFDPLLSLSK